MSWKDFINKNWLKFRKFLRILVLALFILIIVSFYFFRNFTLVFVIIFCLFLDLFWHALILSKPNQSVIESVIGESTFKKYKKIIWTILIIFFAIIFLISIFILPEIGN